MIAVQMDDWTWDFFIYLMIYGRCVLHVGGDIYIYNPVTKLKDDINLWENNIGFLAESKNANLLKREFEKKIQRAKQDVALLNAKLKYLNEQM